MGLADWWKNLWSKPVGSPSEAPRPVDDPGLDPDAEATKLGTTELSANLRVHEYAHAVESRQGRLRVRTFVTEGLGAMRAQEVSATLPFEWGDAAVRAVMTLFQHLERFAAEGTPASLGGYTGFRSEGFGAGRLWGVTYARGTSVRGIPVGTSTLAAVLLHEEEFGFVQRGLATRVLGRLAERARYFPYPAWWELRDAPVFSESEEAQSFIERVNPHLLLRDVRVSRVGETDLVVSLPASAAATFRTLWAEHPDLATFALHADLAPDADAQMIWFAGATEPNATARGDRPPQRFGYAFAIFAGSGDRDFYRGMEDAASVILSTRTFARLREALLCGSELTLPFEDGMTMRLTVRPDRIEDPFTGGTLSAAGGWERYAPAKPKVDVGRVAGISIVLLIPEPVFAERVDVSTLAEFTNTVQRTLERLAGELPVKTVTPVALQFTLLPEAAPRVQIAYQGREAPQMFGPLHEALSAMSPVAVRGEVIFRVEASVHPHPLGN